MRNKIITGFFLMMIMLALFMPFSIKTERTDDFSANKIYSSSVCLYAEGKDGKIVTDTKNRESDEDALLVKVMLAVLIIWGGVSLYLFLQDRQILKLEKEIDEL